MTEFIKLPCGDWINPALIVRAHPTHGGRKPNGPGIYVWFTNTYERQVYFDEDAIALAAALDAMAIKEGM